MSVPSQFCFAMFPSLLFFARFQPVALVAVLLAFADFACLWFFGETDRRHYIMQSTGIEAIPGPVARVFQKPEAIVALFLFVSSVTVMLWIFLK